MTKNCAPGVKYDSENQTCFSDNQVFDLVNAFNKYIASTTNVNINPTPINFENNKKKMLKELENRFKNICKGDHACMTNQDFMNYLVQDSQTNLLDYTFRPMGPEKYNAWLSNNDIEAIMKQYERIYPNFKFLGAVAINCEEYDFCALYNLKFEKYANQNKTKLGLVYNLDKIGQSGSHWVAMYINLITGKIYFADSNGNLPIENINNMVEKFRTYYKEKTGKDIIFRINNIKYQKDGSECGVYSCNFLIRKLAKEKFQSIVENTLNFEGINSCRNVYFRNGSSQFPIHHLCDPRSKK